jgi:lipopolysaccharide biosynthesis regulator YciM
MADTALLAVTIAALAGVLAGVVFTPGRRRAGERARPSFRSSPHYTEGLHCLATGQLETAIHELGKVLREHPDAAEVQQVQSHLYREVGQVERAIEIHRALLKRRDLTRAERAHTLASLGTDFRKAGFLDRAAGAYAEALAVDPKNLHALAGQQKLHEEQRQWREAYEAQTRLARLRKSDDSLVLGFLQAEMGREALVAGRRDEAAEAFRTALSLDRRVFPAHLALAETWMERDPRRAVTILEDAITAVPERAYLAFEPLQKAYAAAGEPSRFVALCERLIGQDPRDWRGPGPAAAGARGQPPRPPRPPGDLAHAPRARNAVPRGAALRRDRGGVGALLRSPHLHRLPLPRRRHAVALPPLPRVEHARGGARGPGRGSPLGAPRQPTGE